MVSKLKIFLKAFAFISFSSIKVAYAAETVDNSYIYSFFSVILNALNSIWTHPIFTMDGHRVSLSNLVIAVILLIVGLKLARYLSDLIYSRLRRIIYMDPNVSQKLGKISHYLFVVIVVIIVLDVAGVPITVFTFIGGAVAISIGVGGQHILNNFMSGLVVMAETPLKVGDLIQVGAVIGRVIEINARCVDIRTHENKNVLIPHSILLQNEFTNWTSSDNVVRMATKISLTQDSINPRDFEKIAIEAVLRCKDISELPRPQVYLLSFETNIMHFEVNYWVNLANINDRRKVISDVNYLLAEELSKEGVTLAIPNRRVIK